MAHVWEKSYPQGVSWDAPLPPAVPLESLLETAASKWPERTALDFYDRTFTFRELHDIAARAAKGLQALGVGPGVHVGLHLPNTPHFVIGFFAVLMAGGRVVNFSPLAAPRELKYQITDAETQIMLTLGLPMLYPQIAALKGTAKFETLVVCGIEDFLPAPIARAFGPAAERVGGAGREIDFAELIANDGAFKRYSHGPIEEDVAVLQYTGGTTGEPKGAMLTHANFYAALGLISPVFADLSGLPPLIIQAGTHEVLLDDAVRLARQAATADVEVTLDITPGVPHVFQTFYPILDEAAAALDRAGQLLSAHLASAERVTA